MPVPVSVLFDIKIPFLSKAILSRFLSHTTEEVLPNIVMETRRRFKFSKVSTIQDKTKRDSIMTT